MGKIFYIMGKSASGKDTIYKKLLSKFPQLKTVVTYTTRPIREGEADGVEYHFTTASQLERFAEEGKVIEIRTYRTALGPWSYSTVNDGQINLLKFNYLIIGTLESYGKMQDYFGEDKLVPLYVEVEDGERLDRALNRERRQKTPNYTELCRRYLADEEDFSKSKLREAGIKRRYNNTHPEQCMEELEQMIGRYTAEREG